MEDINESIDDQDLTTLADLIIDAFLEEWRMISTDKEDSCYAKYEPISLRD